MASHLQATFIHFVREHDAVIPAFFVRQAGPDEVAARNRRLPSLKRIVWQSFQNRPQA